MDIGFDGNFYDADYFERGRETGKGWLENYHWMPRRSFKEAFAYIDTLKLDENSSVLDFGCAKGFIVRALRILDINADGCDISDYALSYAPPGCWNCSTEASWKNHKTYGYTHIICKDVFEHLTPAQFKETLIKLSWLAPKMMCVVPLGDNGKYRIPEYHSDISHIIIENETWWKNMFEEKGWKIMEEYVHCNGLKDNWFTVNPDGNHVFILEYGGKLL